MHDNKCECESAFIAKRDDPSNQLGSRYDSNIATGVPHMQ